MNVDSSRQKQPKCCGVSGGEEPGEEESRVLREMERELKEVKRGWQREKEDREREEKRLKDGLEMRDKLIEVTFLHMLASVGRTTHTGQHGTCYN